MRVGDVTVGMSVMSKGRGVIMARVIAKLRRKLTPTYGVRSSTETDLIPFTPHAFSVVGELNKYNDSVRKSSTCKLSRTSLQKLIYYKFNLI